MKLYESNYAGGEILNLTSCLIESGVEKPDEQVHDECDTNRVKPIIIALLH